MKRCMDCKYDKLHGWDFPCSHCRNKDNLINYSKWTEPTKTLDEILGLEV